MVEGHGVHRVAIAHRKKLLNAAFRATSPNGRFTEGAAAIDGRVLNRVEAHGKNLFYFFGFGEKEQEQLHANTRSSERKEGLEGEREGDENGCVVIHVHFGMSGQFRLHRPPGPEPKSTTRLILQNNKIAAYLSAMTCQHGGQELYDQKVAELGPDPLREDANPERLWQRLQSTSRSVGQMLMDQSVVAGVGNIYRAEILYRVGLHPEQPSNTLSYEDYRRLWKDCVITLQRGVTTGSILTVDPDEKLPEPYKRRYIYNHSKCPRCHGPIRAWDMGGRRAYVCEVCQPLRNGVALNDLPKERGAALRNGDAQHKSFVSHCAPEPGMLTVAKLRKACLAAGLATTGKKAELMARLEGVEEKVEPAETTDDAELEKGIADDEKDHATIIAVVSTEVEADEWEKHTVVKLRSMLKAVNLKTAGNKADLIARLRDHHHEKSAEVEVIDEVIPGTAHLTMIMSAKDAAEEKRLAGEARNVEHVGLVDLMEEMSEDAEADDKTQRKLPFREVKKRRTRSQSKLTTTN